METKDFKTSVLMNAAPLKVFNGINNVRGWWSENIEGSTDQWHSEFVYRDKYLTVKIRITQLTPQKIVWDVVESHNTFFGDKYVKEWDGTQMIFEITGEEAGTELTFTHLGLVPDFECFAVCANSWSFFIGESLKNLIETGKGNDISKDENSYTTTFIVNNSPEEVYKAINNVRGWWSEEIEGKTDEVPGEFIYHYKNVHLSKLLVVELVPNKKVVWFVKDNYFDFVKDKTEWKGTKIIFEISAIGDKTQLIFTHHGLVKENECYDICKDAWKSYIHGSLKDLITTGKGKPNAKEGGLSAELIDKWGLPEK